MTRKKGLQKLKSPTNLSAMDAVEGVHSDQQEPSAEDPEADEQKISKEVVEPKLPLDLGECSQLQDDFDDEFTSLIDQFVSTSILDHASYGSIDKLLSTVDELFPSDFFAAVENKECDCPTTPLMEAQHEVKSFSPDEVLKEFLEFPTDLQAPWTTA
ncbi:hypothetical protein R1flu_028824 [Riccia fluitans]|uniref:Uncharacterized protein n=1 Tax=Riccia fluitans TaxID=41844 RepID=A0ABD1XMT5_9MARC